MRDPLDLLGDLPDYPGNTPPKNRGKAPAPPSSDLNGAKGKVYRINGADVELFTIGELARALGKKPVTIRMWEREGWIPRATYRTPTPRGRQIPDRQSKGRRLYSREQVEFLANAVYSFSLGERTSPHWDKFREHVKTNWPK